MLAADTFAGMVALVVGADAYFGAAAAEELARAGAFILLVGEDAGVCTRLASAITAGGGSAQAVECAILDEAAAGALLARLIAEHGRLDVLVNAGGRRRVARAADLSLGEWRVLAGERLDATFLWSTLFAHTVGDRGGAILNVIQTFDGSSLPGLSHEASAYGAIEALTRTLAVEWAPRDIRVNAIAPGQFDGAPGPVDGATVPALRLGSRQEFGWAVTFLVSSFAAYITGSVFVIDGGNALRRSLLGPPYRVDEFLETI